MSEKDTQKAKEYNRNISIGSDTHHLTGTMRSADDQVLFRKMHEPGSWEFHNEAIRIFEQQTFIRNLSTSKKGEPPYLVPKIKKLVGNNQHAWMDMDFINGEPLAEDPSSYFIVGRSAAFLHTQENRPFADTRQGIFDCDSWGSHLSRYAQSRLTLLAKAGITMEPLEMLIFLEALKKIRPSFFSRVHRDLRLRHFIVDESKEVFLIDWEYSNYSDPLQDFAKSIYDSHTLGLDYTSSIENFIAGYESITNDVDDQPYIDLRVELKGNNIYAYMALVCLQKAESRIRIGGINKDSVAGVKKDLDFISMSISKIRS
jgi:aminoglycoside phosphotransferase (APT) family kinase protein